MKRTLLFQKDLSSRNWGDAIGRYIFKKMTGESPRLIPMTKCADHPHYLTVGSVLRMCDRNSIVWGSGFLTYDDGLGILNWGKANNECREVPFAIKAVRGKFTREKLSQFNVDCPEVFGDPALLMPLFYNPPVSKQYRIGVIPHYADYKNPYISQLRQDSRIKIINVLFGRLCLTEYSRYLRFIDEIRSCDFIFSGSLHGLVVADAYGVPARWIRFSTQREYELFKFYDYYSSVGRIIVEPPVLSSGGYGDLLNLCESETPSIDTKALWEACPFSK